jgi:hypothetical protein
VAQLATCIFLGVHCFRAQINLDFNDFIRCWHMSTKGVGSLLLNSNSTSMSRFKFVSMHDAKPTETKSHLHLQLEFLYTSLFTTSQIKKT